MEHSAIEGELPVQPPVPSIVTSLIALMVTIVLAMLRLSQEVDIRLQRQRTRRCLGALSDHELRDIGLTRGDARFEASRAWWD
jgi:uncharacterized protein YjiS (DUF1127 family)